MRVASIVAMTLALAGSACKKHNDTDDLPHAKPSATLTTGTVVDGVRTIPIEAGKDGYSPERIPGKPGEKLKLVFTRTIDAECIANLKTPDGKTIPLPLNKPVEVAVTVPNDGEIGFACGMDMYHGVIVAEK